jgi:uncharacterized protein YegL
MEQIPFDPKPQPKFDPKIGDNPEPRCACVLLLDVSGSMAEVVGEAGKDLGYTIQSDGQTYRAVSGGVTKIDELNAGLTTFKEALAADSLAAKRVEVAIVTFGGKVQTVYDFTTADSFQPPALTADGNTPMGAAIREAVELLRQRKETYREHGIGIFRPWIFLITDGGPTDEWKSAADLVKKGEASKSFKFYAVGVEDANMDVLKQLSVEQPLKLKGIQFRRLFEWLSGSLAKLSQSSPGDKVQLPDPTAPSGWAVVES